MTLPPQVKQLLKALSQLGLKVARFRLIAGLLMIAALVLFITYRINHYSDTQSDQARIDEQLSKIKRVRFNNDAIDKIKSLQDNTTNVEADLPQNRDNPF